MRFKSALYGTGLFVFCLLLLWIPGQNLATDYGATQEEVTVTAVEVPVRVVLKGQVLKNLTQADFTLLENGVEQPITAFESVSRTIAMPAAESSRRERSASPGRLFILIFNIFDYHENVEQGIDYFFDNVFSQGDQIILVTEDRVLNIERGRSQADMIKNLKNTLKEFKLISTSRITKAYQDLIYEADRLLSELRGASRAVGGSWDQTVIRFFDNYIRIWREYKRQFITPDDALYRGIIKRVKQIEGEKWALCFQQHEMFPRMRNESPLDRQLREFLESLTDPRDRHRVRNVRAKQQELLRIMDIAGDFPAEEMRTLFMEGNITFHLILLKSPRTLVAKDFELREVTSDYQEMFAQISQATGGVATFSNKVDEAIQVVSEKEDHYYLLVYNPKNTSSELKREVEVKVNQSGAEIIFLKDIPKIEAPPISIADFSAGRKRIKFTLKNYQITKVEGRNIGVADVRITIYDQDSNTVFDEGQTLEMVKRETNISLNFSQLKSGRYFIIIQAKDRIAEQSDVYSANIRL